MTEYGVARALVVGLSSEARAAIEAAMRASGWLVPMPAASLAEAFGLVRGAGFDLVVVDITGIEKDASDFVTAIRDERADAGVILVTPKRESSAVKAAAGAHAVTAIEPADAADPESLIATLREVLGEVRQIRRRDTLMRWLERESLTDELTGLYNIRAFHDRLGEVCTVSRAMADPVTLVLIEAHSMTRPPIAGVEFDMEAAFGRLAATIRRGIRSTDFAARIEDNLFAVILPHSELDSGRLVGRRIAHDVDRVNQASKEEDGVLLIFAVVSGRSVSAEKLMAAAQEQLRARKAQRHWVARIA
jgi:PleD family two-component response regulator